MHIPDHFPPAPADGWPPTPPTPSSMCARWGNTTPRIFPGSSLIPRGRLEFELAQAVPHPATTLILCDDDARRVVRAAATAEAMGYRDVSWLASGVNRWASLDLPTEWGVNVPSKDFGERVEVVHHVPEISADDLHERIERGDELVILDTRTPEEYRRFCIPGGRSMPGAELALRITDTLAEAPADATVVVNCAGRTRSIIGTRVLQRMGLDRDIVGLKNGTSGWLLAGYELEQGADRDALPAVTRRRRVGGGGLRAPLRRRGRRPADRRRRTGRVVRARRFGKPLSHRRAHRRRVRDRPHPRLPLVRRRPGRAAQRRCRRRARRADRLRLRRPRASRVDRLLVSADGPRARSTRWTAARRPGRPPDAS